MDYIPSQHAPLPRELLAALPGDPEARLRCGHAIASSAFSDACSGLAAEVDELRIALADREAAVHGLESRNSSLEQQLIVQQQRVRQVLASQSKLVDEKAALVETVKKLNAELTRQEHFRRSLLSQLQEESGVGFGGGGGGSAGATATAQLAHDVPKQPAPPLPPAAAAGGDASPLAFKSAVAAASGGEGSISHGRAASTAGSSFPSPDTTIEAPARRDSSPPRAPSVPRSWRPQDNSGASSGGASPARYRRWQRPPQQCPPPPPPAPARQPSPQRSPADAQRSEFPYSRPVAAAAPPPAQSLGSPPRVDGKDFFKQARWGFGCKET